RLDRRDTERLRGRDTADGTTLRRPDRAERLRRRDAGYARSDNAVGRNRAKGLGRVDAADRARDRSLDRRDAEGLRRRDGAGAEAERQLDRAEALSRRNGADGDGLVVDRQEGQRAELTGEQRAAGDVPVAGYDKVRDRRCRPGRPDRG